MSTVPAQQICELFENELSIVVPDVTTDLIDEGLLDSLVFVELIIRLESAFDVEIPVAELEFDQFRTVTRIADFVDSLKSDSAAPDKEFAA